MKRKQILLLGFTILFTIVFYQNPVQAQDAPEPSKENNQGSCHRKSHYR